MCWETSTLFVCGCTELTVIRLCEHSVYPWTHNVAHPRGLPMNPTVRVEHSREYCSNCVKERGRGVAAPGAGMSGSGERSGRRGHNGKGKGKAMDKAKEVSKDPLGDKMKALREREGQRVAGVGGPSGLFGDSTGDTGAPRVFGQPSASGTSRPVALDAVREKDEDEDEDGNDEEDQGYDDDDNEYEYDDEEDAQAHLEVEAPMLDVIE